MKQTNKMMTGSQKEQIQSTMLTVVSYKGLPHLPSCLCPPLFRSKQTAYMRMQLVYIDENA
jgi:hypothetical protein